MTLFQNKYRIETTRLRGWDYSSDGYYFVTGCTYQRKFLFGDIVNGKMILNEYGEILEKCWFNLPNHYENIVLDAFQIMPNHFHAIIIIDNLLSNIENPKCHGLFEFLRGLKTFSAKRINELQYTTGKRIWQYKFHDHIIRNDGQYQRIRKYIIENPSHFDCDRYRKMP